MAGLPGWVMAILTLAILLLLFLYRLGRCLHARCHPRPKATRPPFHSPVLTLFLHLAAAALAVVAIACAAGGSTVLLTGRTRVAAAWTMAWGLYDWYLVAMGATIAQLAKLLDTAQAVVACVPSAVAPSGLPSMVPTNDVAQYTQLLASVAKTVAGYRPFANLAYSLYTSALLALSVVTLCLVAAAALLHLWRHASTAKIILSPPAFFLAAALWLALGINLVIDSVTEDACIEVAMVATNQANNSLLAHFLQCASPPSGALIPIQPYRTNLYAMCRSFQTICVADAVRFAPFCSVIPTLCKATDTEMPVGPLLAHCPTCGALPGCNVTQVLGDVNAQIGPVTLQNFSQALEKAINGPTDMCQAARQELLTNLTAVCGTAGDGLQSTILGTLALGLGTLAAAALLSLPSRWFHPLAPTIEEFDMEAPDTKSVASALSSSCKDCDISVTVDGLIYCESEGSDPCPTPHVSFCD
eukprot:TRINITY_DN3983_c0_g1_i2.p1 TRINITY_DN3983_c0_g1~~TRINITY_DN3983_c0_g1_i2.p1  ORF type:complete len:471 (+),score=61.76 TRINITY_DN3983_c0_g1_i2:193-1605(+)